MPANKNAMTRYKILDELLSSRYHNYSLDDLTEEVSKRLSDMYPDNKGVVRRTIEKDIYYLEYEGPFLVDIERYSAPGYNIDKQKSYSKQCLRYRTPGFSIFKKDLSNDEEYLLREALSLLGQFDGLPNLDALEGLRLGLGIRNNERKIISLTKNPLENTNLIGELFTAISQQQVVELHYHKFNAPDEVLTVNVHPYLLKEYNRRWFLIAAAETDGKILNFGLERINKITALPAHKYLEYASDINEIFEDIIGVTNYTENEVLKILFWVSDSSKDYVMSKPLHDSQRYYRGDVDEVYRKQYPMLHGGSFFSVECKENYELIRELTSYGEHLVVMSPKCIIDKVQQRITKMQEIYDSTKVANKAFI